MDVGDRPGDAVEGGHEVGESLARLHGPDGQHVRGFRLVTWARVLQGREPVVDDVDPIGPDREVIHEVVRHGL